MSRKILLSRLSKEKKEKIHSDLTISIEPSKFAVYSTPETMYLYDILKDYVYLPFSYDATIPRPKSSLLPAVEYKFQGTLFETQRDVQTDAISTMNNTGSYIIATYTGFGKSITAISIMSRIKLRTLIIVNRVILVKQWTEAIKELCPDVKIAYVTSKGILEKDFPDVIIMNAINIKKKDPSFYETIGFVIVDEIHLIMSKVLSQSMQTLTPKFLLGLSATPYRVDGLNCLIDYYFGKEKTYIPLYHPHKVYRIDTGFTPKIEYVNGHVNWGIVLESQAANEERNELIIRIIKKFSDRVFLVITKRVEQANYLVRRLMEEKEDVTSLIGSQQEFEKSSRVLIGIGSKVSTGFNHPRLNTLIIASDIVEYFIQYLGRVIRKKDTDVIIFDLVDNYRTLEKHFQERVNIYQEAGGDIIPYCKSNLTS